MTYSLKKNYQEFILEVNKHRDTKLMYQYGERNKPENYLPKDPVKDALNNKKVAQIVPSKVNTPIDTRTPGRKLYDLMQKVKGKKNT